MLLSSVASVAAAALLAAPAAAIKFGDGGVGGLVSTPTRNISNEDPPPGKALYTNAVSNCIEPRAILIDSFDIAYWRANHSATFSFSLASIETDLSVRARLYFNAYGIEIFNKEINICDYVQGVLCPLPQVNVTGTLAARCELRFRISPSGSAWPTQSRNAVQC